MSRRAMRHQDPDHRQNQERCASRVPPSPPPPSLLEEDLGRGRFLGQRSWIAEPDHAFGEGTTDLRRRRFGRNLFPRHLFPRWLFPRWLFDQRKGIAATDPQLHGPNRTRTTESRKVLA
jgi:hypothetical protein